MVWPTDEAKILREGKRLRCRSLLPAPLYGCNTRSAAWTERETSAALMSESPELGIYCEAISELLQPPQEPNRAPEGGNPHVEILSREAFYVKCGIAGIHMYISAARCS